CFLDLKSKASTYGTRLKDKYQFFKEIIISSEEWIKKSYEIRFIHKLFAFSVSGLIDFYFLKKIKLKFIDFIKHEDIYFGTILFANVKMIYVLPKKLYIYRIREDSVSDYYGKNTLLPNYLKNTFDDSFPNIKILKEYYSTVSWIIIAKQFLEFSKCEVAERIGFLRLFEKVMLPLLYKLSSKILDYKFINDPYSALNIFLEISQRHSETQIRDNNPDVTLVIPAFNASKFIRQTLESVQKQTLENFECIIVNDFSTDDTLDIIKKTIRNDLRFKIINHRANAGLSASRNTGLRAAKGRYIAFLDADDLMTPNSLLYRKEVLDCAIEKRVIGTYCGSTSIDEDCAIIPKERACKLDLKNFITSRGECPFNANQPMFKTYILRQCGGFNQGLSQAEDYDMWMRILRKGFVFIPTNMILVCYRKRSNSMIRNNPFLHLQNALRFYNDCYQNDPSINGFACNIEHYAKQYYKKFRVVQFIGMMLEDRQGDKLLEILKQEVPDYFLFGSRQDFEKDILYGISRFFNKNYSSISQLDCKLKDKLTKLYKDFYSYYLKNKKINTNETYIDVVFVPHKDYHTHVIKLMRPYLDLYGVSYIILDISMHYRDEKAIDVAKKYGLSHIGYSNFVMQKIKPKSIVVFNDWEIVTKSIIMAAKKSGIKTIGIVEGINDYLDADTGRVRNAYQAVEYLFLPGEHDKKYFNSLEQKLFIGGIPRIYEMFYQKEKQLGVKKGKRIALINSNFSYGVLVEHRDKWLRKAVSACLSAGYKPVITRHPADLGTLYKNFTTSKTFYEELEECDVLISRFASGILEALARNKLPIYFNPHEEKVDKFKEPMNAYPIANSEIELRSVLRNLNQYYCKHSKYFKDFVEYHCGDLNVNPSRYIAKMLRVILNREYDCSYAQFFGFLESLDLVTNSFEDKKILEKSLLNLESVLDNVNKNYLWRCLEEFKNERYEKVEKMLQNLDINIYSKDKLIKLKNILLNVYKGKQ
ncbi:TPA: glycosyltransferase, partial [Campylobacter coli]|nr:glycosyltransferase [Campylobacter coli]